MQTMQNVVFVRRPGGYKCDDSWVCNNEGEADALRRWLRHLGVQGHINILSLSAHERLPVRQPE